MAGINGKHYRRYDHIFLIGLLAERLLMDAAQLKIEIGRFVSAVEEMENDND